MAAPSFVQAGAGAVWTTGAAVTASISATAGNLLIIQAFADAASIGVALSSITNIEALDGTDGAVTDHDGVTKTDVLSGSPFAVGSPSAGSHLLGFGRALSTGTASVACNTTGTDMYFRLYEFSGVHTGTTLSDILENGSAGTLTNGTGTSNTIADTAVVTLGADRLACNFVAVNDDNLLDAFAGMSGGTWAEATAEFAEATGTDGAIGLQTATIASAGTINGGTDTMAASDAWGVVGFALIPAPSGTPHTVNPSDSVALTDARAFAQGQAQADSVVLADSFSRVSVSERAVADSISLTDARALSQGKAVADSVALSDSATPAITTDHTVQPADSVAIGDALTIAWNQDLAGDTVALTDSFSRVHEAERSVSDQTALTDAIAFSQGKLIADTVTLSDQLSTALDAARTLADSITLSDATAFSQGKAIADAVALADALDRVATFARDVADSVALTDQATPTESGEGEQAVDDFIALSDQFSRVADFARSVADSVFLSDAVTMDRELLLTDLVGLTDQAVTQEGQGFTEAISDLVTLSDLVTPVHVAGGVPTLPGVGGPSGPLRPGRRKRRERIQAEEEEIITVLLSEL